MVSSYFPIKKTDLKVVIQLLLRSFKDKPFWRNWQRYFWCMWTRSNCADTVKYEISRILSVHKVSCHMSSLTGICWVISEIKGVVRHTDTFRVWTSCKKYANTLLLSNVRVSPHAVAVTGVTDVLNYVDLLVITNTQCATVFGSYIISSTLCVSTLGGQSTCNVSVLYDTEPIFSVPFIECLRQTQTCVFFPMVFLSHKMKIILSAN